MFLYFLFLYLPIFKKFCGILLHRISLNVSSVLEDANLIEKRYELSMNVDRYPKENSEIRMGTAAFHAEQDLNSICQPIQISIYCLFRLFQ